MAEPAVGHIVDRRYALKREIDRGGIGAVFEADHLFTGRSVAVKVLTAEHTNNPESRERLLREARALTLARHPHVVSALDAGTTEDGRPYLVMELIEGRTVAGILAARQTIPVTDAVRLGVQLCDALSFIHERGVIHRDIKPSNVFVCRNDVDQEVVKLFDFGIASIGGDGGASGGAKLTQQGTVLGTPEYMAPEQLLGQALDQRADIYALGVMLYECVAGSVPFEGTFGEVLLKVSTKPVPPLASRCGAAAGPFAALVERALAKDPAARFMDARELARALLMSLEKASPGGSLLGIRRAGPPPLPPDARSQPQPAARPEAPGWNPGVKARAPPVASAGANPPPKRRRFARAPYVTPVRIVQRDGRSIDGNSEDISEGGLLVLTERPCEAEEPVEIRFALPTTGRIVGLRAIARWVRTARGTGAAGLEFQNLAEEVAVAIRRYVTAMGGEL